MLQSYTTNKITVYCNDTNFKEILKKNKFEVVEEKDKAFVLALKQEPQTKPRKITNQLLYEWQDGKPSIQALSNKIGEYARVRALKECIDHGQRLLRNKQLTSVTQMMDTLSGIPGGMHNATTFEWKGEQTQDNTSTKTAATTAQVRYYMYANNEENDLLLHTTLNNAIGDSTLLYLIVIYNTNSKADLATFKIVAKAVQTAGDGAEKVFVCVPMFKGDKQNAINEGLDLISCRNRSPLIRPELEKDWQTTLNDLVVSTKVSALFESK